MSSKTRFYVIKSKELIYTTLFVVVALVLIILIVCMFLPDKKDNNTEHSISSTDITTSPDSSLEYITEPVSVESTSEIPDNTTIPNTDSSSQSVSYIPGIYQTDILIGGYYLNLSLTVDNDRIKSIELKNLTEAVTTMYPLIEPAMSDIEKELLNSGNIKKLSYTSDNQYTYSVLSDAINSLLSQAVNFAKP